MFIYLFVCLFVCFQNGEIAVHLASRHGTSRCYRLCWGWGWTVCLFYWFVYLMNVYLFVCLFVCLFPEWGDSSAYSIQTWTHQDATGSAGGWGWYCVFISLVWLFNECLFIICLFVCLFPEWGDSSAYSIQTWTHQDATGSAGRWGWYCVFISLVCLFNECLFICLFVCLFVSRMGRQQCI